MKSLIFSKLLRPLKVFISGVALTLTFVNTGIGEAWAKPKSQIITQQIQTLQQSNQRWIQIDLSKQRLIAWEGATPMYAVAISTGKKSTPTLRGSFKIQSKHRKVRMRGDNYDIPNVPYAMFYDGNYGIHGADWHRKFGTPVSHGCVNVAVNHAKWIFNWASVGTSVVIQR
ncbi:MAG: L,D-transpeptidase [Spirirestis rafaelensis WJT71-NPBG6]|jgi:lipoprotein-anchoring transpeptidase ErfK/SrfK|nr:L,D-transpeptidase [Spirirestis rafaelensis WJT71-NPBG6]